jgi:hypothetical protein
MATESLCCRSGDFLRLIVASRQAPAPMEWDVADEIEADLGRYKMISQRMAEWARKSCQA